MASCDDDFSLLADDSHSHHPHHPPHHHHHHHHHHHPQPHPHPHHHHQPPFSPSAAAAAAAAAAQQHRYVGKPVEAPSIRSQKERGGDEVEDYGEAFSAATAAAHDHCFADEDPSGNPFGTDGAEDDENEDGDKNNNNNSSQPDGKADPAAIAPKRKDREELSDGGLPYCLSSKKSRPQPASAASGDYRKDREEWSDSAIGCLLDAYTDKYVQLNRGNLRGRDWEDVATIVSERCDKQKSGKSVEQCKNKIDNLKKRYKAECQRLNSGSLAVSHWPWFKKLEQIVASSSSSSRPACDDEKSSGALAGSPSVVRQTKRYSAATPGAIGVTYNLKTKQLSNPRWKRVVLKISGAALAGNISQNAEPKVTMLIAREIAMANHAGVEVAVVIGGRNFFSGDTWVAATGIDRATAYQIGMMASVMNSVLLQASLEKIGVPTCMQTAFMMQEIAEPYIRRRAIRHLEKGRVVIFGGIGAGTGSPLFTTDTAAALRASEINADAVLKGTNVDGVYDCHPRNGNNGAFEHISFREMVSRGFTAMDLTAIIFCEENNIPVVLFNLLEPGNISRALCGDQVGTLIDQSGRIG